MARRGRARAHAGPRLERDAEHAGEVVAAATGQDAEHAAGAAQGSGHRPDQSVATERDGELARPGCGDGQLPRVLEAARALDAVLEAQSRELGLDSGELAAGTSAAGGRIDDQRAAFIAATSAWRVSAIATGAGSDAASASARVVTPLSTIAASSPAAAAPARSASSRSPTTSVRAGAEPVEGGEEDLRVGLADDPRAVGGRVLERGHDRAGARPHAVLHRERAVAPGAEHLGAGEHGLGGRAQLGEAQVAVAGDDDDVRLGLLGRWR